jgi:hypothetical protein
MRLPSTLALTVTIALIDAATINELYYMGVSGCKGTA